MAEHPPQGRAPHQFPTTRFSAVSGAAADDPERRQRSWDLLIAAYWKPVYKYLRVKWRRDPDDAQDLTQSFFLRAMEKEFFASYDPARARFRTFLKTCLDGFVSNEQKARDALKRGGQFTHVALEFTQAEGEIETMQLPSPETLDRYFEIEWTRRLFELALADLRAHLGAHGKHVHYQLFEAYDVDAPGGVRPTYAELGSMFNLPVTQVTNFLALARREFRRILLDRLRDITATDDEFRREARLLLGTEVES